MQLNHRRRQSKVSKLHRLTIPAGRAEIAENDNHHPDIDIRWRTYDCTYIPVEVPEAVATAVHALIDAFGLVYAAPDFIVTPEGEWVFHGDLNPNGQWAWIEPTRRTITAAIADALIKGVA